MTATAPTRDRVRVPLVPVALVLAGLAAAGFAGRLPVTSTSAELPAVVAALGGSGVLTGLVSALPPLVFAAGSFLAPPVIARAGVARTLVAATLVVALGLVARVAVVRVGVFLAGTVLALAGIALANVALPAAVKLYLPHRAGLGTATYTLLLAAGTAVAAAATVPLGQLLGGWRAGLGMWALLAVLAALPWIGVAARDRGPATEPGGPAAVAGAPVGIGQVARSRLGRAIATVFAGQAASSYVLFAYLPSIAVEAGASRTAGGLVLGLFSVLGVAGSVVPLLAGRLADQRALVIGLAALWVVGDVGLVVAPGHPWPWAAAAGLGASLFPLSLALIPMRSATVLGSAALSAFAQGTAYLLAAVFVFLAGVVHDATGSWTPVLLGLALVMVPVSLAGLRAGRPGLVEHG